AARAPCEGEGIVYGSVVARHAVRRKPLLEALAHAGAIEALRLIHSSHGIVDRRDDVACHARIDDFGYRSAAPGNDGRYARHGFYHVEAERLRPVDREDERGRIAEKRRLLRFIDFTDELDAGSSQERLHALFEIRLVLPVHLRCYLERHTGAAR